VRTIHDTNHSELLSLCLHSQPSPLHAIDMCPPHDRPHKERVHKHRERHQLQCVTNSNISLKVIDLADEPRPRKRRQRHGYL
jgi:hypothetical protein